jgi:hypothetical protein
VHVDASRAPRVVGQRPDRVPPATIDPARAVARRGRSRRRPGRRTKLTDQLQERLATAVAEVGFVSVAARSCGVPPSVVHEWLARGLGRNPNRPLTRRYA